MPTVTKYNISYNKTPGLCYIIIVHKLTGKFTGQHGYIIPKAVDSHFYEWLWQWYFAVEYVKFQLGINNAFRMEIHYE